MIATLAGLATSVLMEFTIDKRRQTASAGVRITFPLVSSSIMCRKASLT